MEWQPIETAPKDGTQVLIYGDAVGEISGRFAENPVMATAQWQFGEWYVAVTDAYVVTITPTHWMPLPTPPSSPDTPS